MGKSDALISKGLRKGARIYVNKQIIRLIRIEPIKGVIFLESFFFVSKK